jgi:hypothetical protein
VTARERRVGIDLLRLDEPETYARSEKFEVNRGIYGRHFFISAGYQRGSRAIATAIERAYETWAAR